MSSEESLGNAPGSVKRLLRWVSGLVLLGLMAVGGHQTLRWEPYYLPVRVVSVAGELRRLSPEMLQETVIAHLRGGIVTQDLERLKLSVEALPWVSTASMRRMWPDRIELTVREHVPLARWGEDGLVSTQGVVFRPPASEIPGGLPLLSAADARAPELTERLEAWRPRLAGLGLSVEHIALDARGAWEVRTDAGFDLAFGRQRIEERMSRFLGAWPSLSLAGQPALVDMRYSNGLAVTWAEVRQETPGHSAHAGFQVEPAADAGATYADVQSNYERARRLDVWPSSRPQASHRAPSYLNNPALGPGSHRS